MAIWRESSRAPSWTERKNLRAAWVRHGVNVQREAVLRRRLTRGQFLKLFEKLSSGLVGMEVAPRLTTGLVI